MKKYQVIDIYKFKYKTLISEKQYKYNEIITGSDGRRYQILFEMQE